MKGLFLVSAVVFSLNAFSAETSPSATTNTANTTTATVAATPGKLLAGIETRPTFFPEGDLDNRARTENNVLAGYQFSPNAWAYYRQDFSTNLSNFGDTDGGLALRAEDGSFRGGLNKIWESGNWSLNYEGRAYTPTSSFSSDSGMITYVRNYFYLNNAVSDTVTLYVAESPTFHFYSQDLNAAGKPNTNLENRTYVGANWKPTNNVSFFFPVKMSNGHLRVSGANDVNWKHRVYINPELFYRIDANFKVGVGIETASFVDDSFGNFSFGNAFERSKSYAVLAASL